MTKEEIHKGLADAVVDMDENTVANLSEESVRNRLDAYETIDMGLAKGMERAGKLFEE